MKQKFSYRCPHPIQSLHLESWLNAIESGRYKKHTNFRPRFGTAESRLPTMLRTLLNRWSPGGVLVALYYHYTRNMVWAKGYNGYIATFPTGEYEQFYVPATIINWAFSPKTMLETEQVQSYIYQYDEFISKQPKWPTRREIQWRFPKK